MKKYTLVSFVFVLALTLLVGFKFVSASDSGCNGTGVYSTTTGQLCSTTTLQIGSRGVAVQAFQQTLKNAGFLSGKVDGIYGKMTSAAATAYYKIHPITQPTVNTPTPVSTSTSSTTTTTTTPSITISFPTAGATLVEGQTYNITWNASAGLPTATAYRMDLFNAKVATIKIADINNIYSQNSFSWTVPSIPSWGGAVVPQDGYSVRMFLSDYSTAPYSSPTFKIVSNNFTATLLPGCTSTSGYSSTNGVACDGSTPTQAFACTNGYDSTTGFVCGCTSTSGYSSTTGNACGSSSNFLPGCTSTSGYSSTNGVACDGSVPTPTYPAGCTSTSGYSSTTGLACNGSGISNPAFPVGCLSNQGYSSTNGEPCSATTSTTSSVPTISLTADNTNVSYGGSTTLHWSSTNATYCKNGTLGNNLGTSGSLNTGALNYTTTYYFNCGNTTVSTPVFASVKIVVAPNSTTSTYPAGCTSNVGYSSTNGVACDGSTTAISAPYISTCTTSGYDSATGFRCGCSSVSGYSSTTGLACGTASNFKAGCTSTSGFSSIDGSSCSQ